MWGISSIAFTLTEFYLSRHTSHVHPSIYSYLHVRTWNYTKAIAFSDDFNDIQYFLLRPSQTYMHLHLWDKTTLILNLVDAEPGSSSASSISSVRLHVPEPWWAENSFVRAARLGSLWCCAKFRLEYLLIHVFSNCQNCLELWDPGFFNPSDQPVSQGIKSCFRVAIAHKFILCNHKKGVCGEKSFTGKKRLKQGVIVSHFICCAVTTVPQKWKHSTGRIGWEISVYYNCLLWMGQHSLDF